jgi:putative flippase GtrA
MKTPRTHIKFVDNLLAKHQKKAKFVIVGACCFLINSIILYLLTRANVNVAIAQIIGYEGGLLFGFYANAKWTYKHNTRGSAWSSLLKYHWASLSALILSTLIVVVLNKWLGLHPNLALVFASAVAMVWNYVLFDRFVFHHTASGGIWNRFVAFFRSDFGLALAVVVLWQIALTGFGMLIERTLTAPHGTSFSLFSHTSYWDSGWYNSIINQWYHGHDASPAFYPLYPLAVEIVRNISFGALHELASAFLVNSISLWLALTAFIKIARYFLKDMRYVWWAVALLLLSPAAFFFHQFYSEAFFCAFVFWAYWFALSRRWGWMAVLLALATAIRLPAVLFIGLCGLEYLRAYQWNLKRAFNWRILWFLLTPLGFVCFGLYLYAVRGDFLAMFHAYKLSDGWAYQVFDPDFVATIFHALQQSAHIIFGSMTLTVINFVKFIVPAASLLILIVASVYAVLVKDRRFLPLGVFGLAAVIFFTLNSNVVSVHRYVLPCIVIYLVGGHLAQQHTKLRIPLAFACYCGVLLQVFLYILFIMHSFTG